MALVPAKCTQCGANIEVDESKEAGICPYCNTAFITEKTIINYTKNITENIVNNNNFIGANVTVQNDENMDGLLRLAKRELYAQNYSSEELFQYLDHIIMKSSDGSEQILKLFHEMGLYQMAEAAFEQVSEQKKHCALDFDGNLFGVLRLLRKYDPDNIVGWYLDWKLLPNPRIKSGKKVIQLAKDSEKARYEKEIYMYYIKEMFNSVSLIDITSVIPLEYIQKNEWIQDELIKKTFGYISSERLEYIKSILPEERADEINKNPKPLPGPPNGGCYIATCAYGSYDCPQVWTLRRFRDNTLEETWYGQVFIKCYYAISPKLVQYFGNIKWFQNIWRCLLDKFVLYLNNKGVENTFYQDKNKRNQYQN